MPFPRLFIKTSKVWVLSLYAVLTAFIWLFLWYGSWQVPFRSFIWFRLGIGLILFIVPGLCVYGLLRNEEPVLTPSHVTFGFVISHLLFALLGILGRYIHLSFQTIKLLMVLLGLILVLQYSLTRIRMGIKITPNPSSAVRFLPGVLLLLVSAAACMIVIQRVLTSDDLTYLAYVNNWQNSIHLDFNDIIFGKPELVQPRFWLMSVPFAQALLADISRVPAILLLSGYYEPFLVIIAVLCWYELARTLELSPQAASASSILQLVFLLFLSEYLHPGAPFFTQLSADKATAAFILAPVFFQSLFQLLQNATKSNFIIFFLTGFSLTLMHPVIVAYSIFIGGVLVLLNWKKFGASERIVTFLILLVILLPQIALRFASTSVQVEIPYTTQAILNQGGIEDMIRIWDDTQFYGFNPSILDMNIPYAEDSPIPQPVMTRGWLLFPILSAIFSLKHAGKKPVAQFLLACFLLSLLAWFPFTGWIIGYFLSAYMLERAVWLFPFGLSAVYTFSALADYVRDKLSIKGTSNSVTIISSNWFLTAVTLISIGAFALYLRENSLPDFGKFTLKTERYQDLSTAGQKLDDLISGQEYVLGSPNLNDLIPGISWKSNLITFRISDPSNMSYFTQVERDERISDSKRIFSRSLSPENKMRLIQKHKIRFVFLRPFDLQLFSDLMEAYPDKIETIEIGGVIIINIHQ